MLACSAYSAAAMRWLRLIPRQPVSSRHQFLKIAALSTIFCFSVVCGNTSLRYLPVSFNQAIGATTPFFTAVFSLLITCRRESVAVYLALLPVVLGIVLASNSEPLFRLFGFLVCISSTAGRALKSIVQGILLTSDVESYKQSTYCHLLLGLACSGQVEIIASTFVFPKRRKAVMVYLTPMLIWLP